MNGTFVDDLREQATRTPESIAVRTADERLTYRDLVERIDRLAGVLRGRAVGPEVVCAVAVDGDLDALVAMAAVIRAGGAFCALDTGQPNSRIKATCRGAGARVLIADHRMADRCAGMVPGPTVLVEVVEQDVARLELPTPTIGETLAYVSPTSGSTGTPNAVLVEHRGLRSYLRFLIRDYGLGVSTVALHVAPVGYDASIRDMFAPLMAGGQLVLVPRAQLLRPEGLAEAVRDFQVTTLLSVTPSLLAFFLRHEQAAAALGQLSLVVSSGESLRPFLASGGRQRLSGRLVNQYGPTECTMTTTRYEVPSEPEPTVDLIGKPIDGATVRLLDAELQPVPTGQTGDVYISGVGVARGYGGRSALTADRFLPDPLGLPGSRMYRTGDLAQVRPDGNLIYLGRSDRQIKIRGYRVDPAEIEGALLTHPAITGAVITAISDEQDRTYLVAHVVGPPAEVSDAALRAHLAGSLAYYMMPRRFVRIDRLPTTHSGKIDRSRLAVSASAAHR